MFSFCLRGDIGRDFYGVPVAGAGGQRCVLHILLTTLLKLNALNLQPLDQGVIRLQVQLACVGIEQNRRAIGQCQHLRGNSTQSGQAQSAGQNGNVTGGSTAHRGKAHNFAGVQCRRL